MNSTRQIKRLARARRMARFKHKWGETYTKRITTFIMVNAVLWVWCSYGLALLGRYEIAQSLSQTAITAILGVVITNGAKSVTENISKNGYVGKIKDAGAKILSKRPRIFDMDEDKAA